MNANQKWRKQNPEKVKAHWQVEEMKRRGELTPQPCEKCGSTVRIHAHHDDYSKPAEVRWLCSKCHRRLHALQQGQYINSNIPEKQKEYYRRYYKKVVVRKYQIPLAPKKELLGNAAQELREQGLSYKEIGEKIGVSKGTVYKWLNDVNYS